MLAQGINPDSPEARQLLNEAFPIGRINDAQAELKGIREIDNRVLERGADASVIGEDQSSIQMQGGADENDRMRDRALHTGRGDRGRCVDRRPPGRRVSVRRVDLRWFCPVLRGLRSGRARFNRLGRRQVQFGELAIRLD